MAVKAARLDQLVAVLEVEDGEGDHFRAPDTIRANNTLRSTKSINPSCHARHLLKRKQGCRADTKLSIKIL